MFTLSFAWFCIVMYNLMVFIILILFNIVFCMFISLSIFLIQPSNKIRKLLNKISIWHDTIVIFSDFILFLTNTYQLLTRVTSPTAIICINPTYLFLTIKQIRFLFIRAYFTVPNITFYYTFY